LYYHALPPASVPAVYDFRQLTLRTRGYYNRDINKYGRINVPEKAPKRKSDLKFHKDSFEKTTEERRLKVLEVATLKFATKGYNSSNINEIASKSGISIGALYSYFASKEDLFLAVVNNAYKVLEAALKNVVEECGSVSEMIRAMLRTSREYAIKYPELNQLYLELTTQSLSRMADRLSGQIETITVSLYRDILKRAKDEGKIGAGVDIDAAAFCIDNIVVMYQFSFSADYYKERMKIFLGGYMDIQQTEDSIVSFIRRAILAAD
jgi:TetR/AcrR family transcriptional regulator